MQVVETTINDVDGFKTFRAPAGKPDAPKGQQRMRKGIADLYRRSETSQACNDRFLRALASVDDTTPLGELTVRLGQPVKRNGRRGRALNPFAPSDARLIAAISRGIIINGFRNKDLRELLFADAQAGQAEQRRNAAAVSRQIALLRAQRLVRKGPRQPPLSPVGQRHGKRGKTPGNLCKLEHCCGFHHHNNGGFSAARSFDAASCCTCVPGVLPLLPRMRKLVARCAGLDG